jgi:GrpB-like predicted nucleotidyltransferase (UPF0157 family)
MGSSNIGKPIAIADYDPDWQRIFDEERALIYATCGRGAFTTIEHVGSTAVPGLAAKPIVDMMPGLRSLDDAPPVIEKLQSIGYVHVPEFERPTEFDDGMPFRRYLRKDRDGVRAFHMHMVEHGSQFWRDHLLFRNHLIIRSEDRDAYARLKREIAARYNANLTAASNVNVGYTDNKTEFIEGTKAKARANMAGRTPPVVVDYDSSWPMQFTALRDSVAAAAGDVAVDIQHIGSTSVPGLAAKPHVDLAIGVRTMGEGRTIADALAEAGFALTNAEIPDWSIFVREVDGVDLAHLHMVPHDGWRWHRYVLFRDYLRSHDDARDRYGALKYALAVEYADDQVGYTFAKTEFVSEIYGLAGAPLYIETWAPLKP